VVPITRSTPSSHASATASSTPDTCEKSIMTSAPFSAGFFADVKIATTSCPDSFAIFSTAFPIFP